ncbi:alpha/beta fold hydrolase [Pleionea mediterranea]|uniref:Pimeloyl-ACP methyl ester carboxylesterase n=1 Tax=Pleionea mediterranea TaxID=523701 RepID=A0A316G1Y5_9GAMM|nr:alpha/beta hydrolase [Pleionea mediterranea]PWK53906.1 pimeloyl-ACP methyl ester carboxylesterase [Pleionea mediterranea]
MNKRWLKQLCQHTIPTPVLIIVIVIMSIQSSKAADFTVERIGEGPAVILIPGLMSDDRVWQTTVDALKQDYQLHLVSIAGFAGSPPVSSPSLKRVKQQLLSYIQQQQLQHPVIIGHSLGGFMGFWLASSEPDIIGPVVSVDGLSFVGPVFTQTNQTTVQDLKLRAEQIKLFYSKLSQQQLRLQTQTTLAIQTQAPAHQKIVLNMAEASDPTTVGEAMHILMTTDLRQQVANITQPVLLLGASGAFPLPQDHKRVNALYQSQLSAIPNASLLVNTRARHFIMYDDPDWLTQQLTQFLEQSL